MIEPRLRFPEFEDSWRTLTIGKVTKEDSNPVPMPEGGYTRVGIYCHAKGTFQEYVPADKKLSVDKMFVVHKNNLIVNISFAWEHAIAITKEEDDGLLVSHRFPSYAFKKGYLHEFFKYLILDKRVEYDLKVASPGGAGRNRVLNKEQFLNIPVYIPSEEEQRKIADTLLSVDELITTLTEEVRLWEEKKKGVMQKIFSQEVRFKDENGEDYPEWEEKMISDIARCFAGATPSTKEPEYWENGDIPWMSSGEVNLGEVFDTEKRITRLGYDKCSTKMVKQNSVVMALAGQGKTRGMVAITRIPLCTNQSLCAIEPNEMVLSDYLYQYLKTQYENLRMVSSGDGTRGGLNLKLVGEYPCPIPCIEEQQKISTCLLSIDQVIEVKKQKLETWKTIKKGLLQQMFV